MANILKELCDKGIATGCPSWLPLNTHYMTIMGSHAYGCADTSVKSKIPDYDVYGFAIPPKEYIFFHLQGHIQGFGPEPESFDQYQKHHMFEQDALGGTGKEWDFQIFNIVKFFELCRENNPNMIDSLFTPDNCVIHCTRIGQMVRDNRRLFLSKEAWKKFRGYAQSQLKKMNDKNIVASGTVEKIRNFEDAHEISHKMTLAEIKAEIQKRGSVPALKSIAIKNLKIYEDLYERGIKESQRFEIYKFHNFDTKFAYHILRLFDEAEQILLDGDINLQRAKELMKAIRRGDWTPEEIRNWVMEKEKALEAAYVNCKLPERPPVEPLRLLLVRCLEEHYGSLANCVAEIGWSEQTLKDIDALLSKVRKQLYN